MFEAKLQLGERNKSLRWLAVSQHPDPSSLSLFLSESSLARPWFPFIQRPQNCWPKIIQASLKALPRKPEPTWLKNTFRRIAGAGLLEIIKNTDPFRCLHCRSKKLWAKVLKQYEANIDIKKLESCLAVYRLHRQHHTPQGNRTEPK